jgi:hypothetical protein
MSVNEEADGLRPQIVVGAYSAFVAVLAADRVASSAHFHQCFVRDSCRARIPLAEECPGSDGTDHRSGDARFQIRHGPPVQCYRYHRVLDFPSGILYGRLVLFWYRLVALRNIIKVWSPLWRSRLGRRGSLLSRVTALAAKNFLRGSSKWPPLPVTSTGASMPCDKRCAASIASSAGISMRRRWLSPWPG